MPYISPWNVGDIVIYKGVEIVILNMISYENEGSTCYDRKYKVCELSKLESVSQISESDFNSFGYWINISGKPIFPEYIKTDKPPFEIKSEKIYKFRQKHPVVKVEYI